MATRNVSLSDLCVFCSFNASKTLLSRTVIRRMPKLSLRSFSATSMTLRTPGRRKPPQGYLKPTGGANRYEDIRKSRPRIGGPNENGVQKGFRQEHGQESRDNLARRCNILHPTPEELTSLEKYQLEQSMTWTLKTLYPQPWMLDTEKSGYLAEFLPSGTGLEEVQERWKAFRSELLSAYNSDDYGASGSNVPSPRRLAAIYSRYGSHGLRTLLRSAFIEHMGHKKPPATEAKQGYMEDAVDMRFPQEWYTATRQMQRTWHLHVGPTNSGKTYHALKRLEESGNGIYAGPLRLLAQEIYERMNAKGIPCNLVTGDDVRTASEWATVESSTMEMVDLNKEVDICVIDEIQMIGDEDRGWAWTQAVLGVRAKELHLCGEERTVDLIKKLASSVGDKLTIHWYKRLGPLEVEEESLGGDLKKIQKGDCIVTFSRRNIFALKRSIEEQTGKRCAVVYGTLPPETRSTQAQLFNDEDNDYDVLVASDAVGMGLNLSIKRVIFEAVEKWNGERTIAISIPQIKQISGRAGRYRVPGKKEDGHVKPGETIQPLPQATQVGYVTTLENPDLKAVKTALTKDVKPIKTAGIMPLVNHIEQFAAQFENKPFSFVMRRLEEYVRTSNLFHACSFRETIEIAQLFDPVKGLTVADRMTFLMAPIGRSPLTRLAVVKMAECAASGVDGSILRIGNVDLEAIDSTSNDAEGLQRLEALHKTLIVYLWLSYRFPVTFAPRETAQEIKQKCEKKIEECLQHIRFTRRRNPPKPRTVKAQSLQTMANFDGDGNGLNKPEDHHEPVFAGGNVDGEEDFGMESMEGCRNRRGPGHARANCSLPGLENWVDLKGGNPITTESIVGT